MTKNSVATLALVSLLALSACDVRTEPGEELAGDRTASSADPGNSGEMAVADPDTIETTAVRSSPSPGVERSGQLRPGAKAARTPRKAADVIDTIPEALRGKWREVPKREAGDTRPRRTVSAAQCDSSDYGNAGKILTVRDIRFSFFEEGGRLLDTHERSEKRIRATFDTTYADTPTQMDYIFDVEDGGTSLVVRQYGDGARPGPLLYKRCPA